MNSKRFCRRQFMAASAGGLAMAYSAQAGAILTGEASKPALLGGRPVRTKPFPQWPVWDASAEEHVLSILRSGNWFRGSGETVTQFEKAYAELLGARRALCVVNGTNALLTAMHVLDVGVGDEVIVPPYTFIATYNVVFQSCACLFLLIRTPRRCRSIRTRSSADHGADTCDHAGAYPRAAGEYGPDHGDCQEA